MVRTARSLLLTNWLSWYPGPSRSKVGQCNPVEKHSPINLKYYQLNYAVDSDLCNGQCYPFFEPLKPQEYVLSNWWIVGTATVFRFKANSDVVTTNTLTTFSNNFVFVLREYCMWYFLQVMHIWIDDR